MRSKMDGGAVLGVFLRFVVCCLLFVELGEMWERHNLDLRLIEISRAIGGGNLAARGWVSEAVKDFPG
jgi:hypothetical protein